MKVDSVSEQIAAVVLDALADIKAQNVLSLDVRSLTGIADFMVIASGTSSRHVKALADNVVEKAKDAGFRPLGVEGERDAEWVLIDLAGVIVHVMLPATRKFYDLERLWTTPDAAAHQG
ncbi:ribosome silencing factor [Agitococcus lubricus]|uniref:Ribosomal silencing factor RsfS n=1 Tax=Agitococcus lubricus TaxID=1077255 RepID=A0A2T5J1T0_9GAMM|nr:ribosome silencing factor [Agitococcus lubricus]PTQ90400.1 ribosome-associated protein [Agitococcus lubricus]